MYITLNTNIEKERKMLHRKHTISFVIRFLLLPYFVASETSFIYNYGPDNFKRQVEQLDGNFIMFYAPWCRHCTDFQPIWEELAEMVNTAESKFGIAQVDCTIQHKLCHVNDITGYPTLLYFYKNTYQPVEYRGTRDLPSLTLFLSEVFNMKSEGIEIDKLSNEVKIYSGMAYLTDQNFEKFVSKGQHFIMFYAPWCKASQRLAVMWAELAVEYAHNDTVQIGKINCMDHQTTCLNFNVREYPRLLWIVNGKVMSGSALELTLDELKKFVVKMARPENHDPEKYMTRKNILPVVRISEDTFDSYMKKELVFINFYAPWCAHCKQLVQVWLQLGDKFQNDSRIIIADVDCSQSEKLCVQEDIYHFPTLILYKNSKVIHQQKGSTPLENLTQIVQVNLDKIDLTNPALQAKDEL